jgi:type IV secretory pathway VirD2 relaxase
MSTDEGHFGTKGKRAGLWDSAARTIMEAPAFRVRLGIARPGTGPARTAPIRKLAGRIKAMVRQHGGGNGKGSARRYSTIGRGGHAAAQFSVRSYRQRVTVKARVVRHKGGAAGKAGPGAALRKHVSYLERDGAGEGGERGVAFNAQEDVTHPEAIAFTKAMEADRHHFRFIVSPEAGEGLDLRAYAQELVGAMEADLGTKLQWLGVAHYNTDNPHVHLLVRGRDEGGGDLVMHREYISHGLRAQAMEVATRHLGPRLDVDIERAARRDLRADRLTALDMSLAQEAALRSDGLVSALRAANGALAGERARVNKLARLAHLESLGLAQEQAAGVWRVPCDLVSRLRTLGERGDIVKLIHERARGSEPTIATVIFSKESPPRQAVTGRVFDRGVSDELYDRRYLLVEALDGKAYYVPLSEYSESAGYEAQIGSIVTVTPVVNQAVRAADRNMARMARAQGGIYDPAAHTQWVETQIRLPPGVSASDYVHSHVKRAQALASRGLIEALGDGRYRIANDFPERAAQMMLPARDSGAILKVERHSLLDVERQVHLNGVTWLDQELSRGIDPNQPSRVGATRFERQLTLALKERAARLRELDLAFEEHGQWRARAGFLDQLYERELTDAAHRLQARHGELVRLQAGQGIQGRVEALEQLPSGPHLIVAEAGRFMLIRAQGTLAAQIGKTVELSLGPARTLKPTLPVASQLTLRYRTLELARIRQLGR